MKIKAFGVEEWLNQWESQATWDLAQSTVASLTLEELLELAGVDKIAWANDMFKEKLNYGHIEGSSRFKELVAGLYQTVQPEGILQTNGATGGNLLALYALLEPGDHVLALDPTYQQLTDIPRSLGARVETVALHEEDHWALPVNELLDKIGPETKMICLNSANNPTGTCASVEDLAPLIEAARKVGAYILIDEVYLPFNNPHVRPIVDLYEKGISVNSLSKSFSLPGIRIGWTATSPEIADVFRKYRDYTMICGGVLNDHLACLALEAKDNILARNQAICAKNYQLLREWVNQEPSVSLVLPELVSTSFIKLDLKRPVEDFCIDLLKTKGVLLVPGSAYGREGYARLGYCCKEEVLLRGLEVLSEFLKVEREREFL